MKFLFFISMPMFMRKLKLLLVVFFVALNAYAVDIDVLCAEVREAMPLINKERARLKLKPLEFKSVLDINEVKISVNKYWISYSTFRSRQDIFEDMKQGLSNEDYAYVFLYYADGFCNLCFAEDIMSADEFDRYVASWYDKIFEKLDYSEAFELEVLRLVNVERTKRGFAPLKMHKDLQITARIKSGEMKKYKYYGHGSYPDLPDYLIKIYYNIGENIAMGQKTPTEVVQAWMDSPGHRANILDPQYVYIGVGYCDNYWVQQFAFDME